MALIYIINLLIYSKAGLRGYFWITGEVESLNQLEPPKNSNTWWVKAAVNEEYSQNPAEQKEGNKTPPAGANLHFQRCSRCETNNAGPGARSRLLWRKGSSPQRWGVWGNWDLWDLSSPSPTGESSLELNWFGEEGLGLSADFPGLGFPPWIPHNGGYLIIYLLNKLNSIN